MMEEYFSEDFTRNQTIKTVFNGLLSFIPCDHESYNLFEAVLIKFRKDPNHNYASLEEGLMSIFEERIP